MKKMVGNLRLLTASFQARSVPASIPSLPSTTINALSPTVKPVTSSPS